MAAETCPSCGQRVTVGSDGKFNPHQKGGTGTATCPKSNKQA
ncbi:hypothetical protein [Cryptosporangium sp. NPDC051539]